MQVNEPYLCFSLETTQQRDNLSLEKGVLATQEDYNLFVERSPWQLSHSPLSSTCKDITATLLQWARNTFTKLGREGGREGGKGMKQA